MDADDTTAPEEQDPTLLIMFGTESGNSEDLALLLARAAAERELVVRVAECDAVDMTELARMRHAILIIATAGDGDMPYTAAGFWDALTEADAPRLPALRYGVLALGDRTYLDFCEAGHMIDERLAELGATALVPRQDCDADYEADAERWLDEALDAFEELMLRYPASTADPAAGVSTVRGGGRPWQQGALEARVVLSDEDPLRQIVHYGIRVDDDHPLTWQPGDCVNVRIGNDPELVTAILAELGVTGDEPAAGGERSLSEELLAHREIRLLPRDLLARTADRTGSSELGALLEARDGAVLKRWRDGHDLLQLLREHPRAWRGAAELVDALRPLQPRAYSIASSPLSDSGRIDLTVRTVRYDASDRRFTGTVSGGLSERVRPGSPVALQYAPNPGFRLPDDPGTDIIMVGPGVGVAPFRAFLEHRLIRGDSGRNWLFCGVRDPRSDLLYGEELDRWRRTGLLTELDVCASRGEGPREYVQHRIRRRGAEVMQWLGEGARLYVCGDAERMAGDVQLAVRSAASEALGSVARGQVFVERLRSQRRYLQDVY